MVNILVNINYKFDIQMGKVREWVVVVVNKALNCQHMSVPDLENDHSASARYFSGPMAKSGMYCGGFVGNKDEELEDSTLDINCK